MHVALCKIKQEKKLACTLSTHWICFFLGMLIKREILHFQICSFISFRVWGSWWGLIPLDFHKCHVVSGAPSYNACIPQRTISDLLRTSVFLYIAVNHPHWTTSKCFTCKTPGYSIKHWVLQKGVGSEEKRDGKLNWM